MAVSKEIDESGTVPLFVEQFHRKWNSSTISGTGSRKSGTVPLFLEQKWNSGSQFRRLHDTPQHIVTKQHDMITRKDPSAYDRHQSSCVPLVVRARYKEATPSFSIKSSKYPHSLSVVPLVIFSFAKLGFVQLNDDSKIAKGNRVGQEVSGYVRIHDLSPISRSP